MQIRIAEKEDYYTVRKLTGLFNRQCINNNLFRYIYVIKIIFPVKYYRFLIDLIKILVDAFF